MRPALAAKPAVDFARPEDVLTVAVDPATGYLATPDCPEQREEIFIAGTQPADYCPKHGGAPQQLVPVVSPDENPEPLRPVIDSGAAPEQEEVGPR